MRYLSILVLLLYGCSAGGGSDNSNLPRELRSALFQEFIETGPQNWGDPSTGQLNCPEGTDQREQPPEPVRVCSVVDPETGEQTCWEEQRGVKLNIGQKIPISVQYI